MNEQPRVIIIEKAQGYDYFAEGTEHDGMWVRIGNLLAIPELADKYWDLEEALNASILAGTMERFPDHWVVQLDPGEGDGFRALHPWRDFVDPANDEGYDRLDLDGAEWTDELQAQYEALCSDLIAHAAQCDDEGCACRAAVEES